VNAPLRRVAIACLVLFGLLLVNINYRQVVKASDYRDNARNARAIVRNYEKERGSIALAGANRPLIARSVETPGRLKYLRTYPDKDLYAHVTGFYSLVYGQDGLEDTEDRVLSGDDPRLFVKRLSDTLTGRVPRGGDVVVTLQQAAQQAAYDGLKGKRGAVVALDPRTGAILPIGEQGEICTRGYHVMAGYNDNEEATAKAIDLEQWLHTGDLGRMDSRGYLSITGRVKEMIIRGGENLFPAEIENVMLEHEDVGEVAVVGVPCPTYGEQVACFMRASGSRQPDPAELKAFIRDRLSPQKTPLYWLWVEQWPLTGSGKIQKFKLAEQFASGVFAVHSSSSS